MVNAAGLVLAKAVPVERLSAFVDSGLGSAPVWDVFTVDAGIAFTDTVSAVGDRRLRIDPDALAVLGGSRSGSGSASEWNPSGGVGGVPLGDGLAWAPTDIVTQDGEPVPTCPEPRRSGRSRTGSPPPVCRRWSAIELELVLVQPDGSALEAGSWVPVRDQRPARPRGVRRRPGEQLRGGRGTARAVARRVRPAQFEISLPPAGPLEAADDVVLVRVVIGRVARRHGLRASFSPSPVRGGGRQRRAQPFLLGPRRCASCSRVAPDRTASPARAAAHRRPAPRCPASRRCWVVRSSRVPGCGPGFWSGAFPCWGRENREAAVRFLEATPGNPHGANVEVKPVDPSANPYLSSAAVLGGARRHRRGADLPAEVAPSEPGRPRPTASPPGSRCCRPTSRPSSTRSTVVGPGRRLLGDRHRAAVSPYAAGSSDRYGGRAGRRGGRTVPPRLVDSDDWGAPPGSPSMWRRCRWSTTTCHGPFRE